MSVILGNVAVNVSEMVVAATAPVAETDAIDAGQVKIWLGVQS